MTRPATAAILAASQAVQAEFVHLIEVDLSSGNLYLNTGGQRLSWNGLSWEAVGGLLTLDAVQESSEDRGRGMQLQLSGVDQSIVGALLNSNYRGRMVRVWRAYLDRITGAVLASPLLLFEGLQMSPYEVSETRDRVTGTVTIKTQVLGHLGVEKVRGIEANVTSHQHIFSGETFFQNVASLANLHIYWGTDVPTTLVPPGIGPGGPPSWRQRKIR